MPMPRTSTIRSHVFANCAQPLDHVSADARRIFHHAVLFERVDHSERRRARHRISAESRAMTAGRKARRNLLARDHRADRNSAAQRLGQRHDIGLDARMLDRRKTFRCAPCRSALRQESAAACCDRTNRAPASDSLPWARLLRPRPGSVRPSADGCVLLALDRSPQHRRTAPA